MRLNDLHWYATAAFGLEGIVSAELKRLGMRDVQAAERRRTPSPAPPPTRFAPVCGLRSADRVLLDSCGIAKREPSRSCFSW